jgi:hypothetical protein
MSPEMKEFNRQLRRYKDCMAMHVCDRAKKYGKSWAWMASNIWYYAKEAGLSEQEALPLIRDCLRQEMKLEDLAQTF